MKNNIDRIGFDNKIKEIYDIYNEIHNIYSNIQKCKIRSINARKILHDKKFKSYLERFIQKQNQNEELNYLNAILSYLIENKSRILRIYFRDNGKIITERLRSLDNQKIALKVEEIYYLIRYLKDIISWSHLTGTQKLSYFSQRLNLFIHGYQNQSIGVDYKSILTYFKDEELMEEIQGSDVLRQLANYSEQRQFFASMLRKIRSGVHENDWKDFELVWKDRKKYEKRIFGKFGNEKFGSMFKALRKKEGQNPMRWIKIITGMVSYLDNPQYEYKEVIFPAAKKLIILFEKRIIKLIDELKKDLSIKIKELEKGPNKKLLLAKTESEEIDLEIFETKKSIKPLLEKVVVDFGFLKNIKGHSEISRPLKGILPWNSQLAKRLDANHIHASIPIMLLSGVSSTVNILEEQESAYAEDMNRILQFNTGNLKKEIEEIKRNVNDKQNDLDIFLRKYGLDKIDEKYNLK
ncbi:MAG: hypothetical protein QF798_02315 [Candidatus Woesearchaeota archaeon]|nr:hypothetical protein [archaeon]MDP6600248.1 hypothetical protein [Candidatus Woesearchaeota archaeon]